MCVFFGLHAIKVIFPNVCCLPTGEFIYRGNGAIGDLGCPPCIMEVKTLEVFEITL